MLRIVFAKPCVAVRKQMAYDPFIYSRNPPWIVLLYVLFLGVCALLVNPEKEYDKNSNFYRFLLDSATAAMKLLRIRVHISGI